MTTTMHGYVMLGKTVPEPSKRENRIYVCSAGWHPDHGLVRVYPLGRTQAPARWSTSDVVVERNPSDTRHESWRLPGDRKHPDLNSRCFTVTGEWPAAARAGLVAECEARGLVVESVEEANARRMSLALMLPDRIDVSLTPNDDSPDSPQLRLFDTGQEPAEGARRFPWIPRLVVPGGHREGLLLRDWGTFEHMRKHPGLERDLPNRLHLSERSAVLVGNLSQHRRTWVAISVLNIREQQLQLAVSA